MPRTVIHGEFYASNVLVAGDVAEPRVLSGGLGAGGGGARL